MDEEWKSQLMEASASKSLEWKWSPPQSGHDVPSYFTRCFGDGNVGEKMVTKGEGAVGHTNALRHHVSRLRHQDSVSSSPKKKVQHRDVLRGSVEQEQEQNTSKTSTSAGFDPRAMLQRRSKWLTKMRPLSIGDVVLMVDEIQPREKWNLAVVVDFDRSEDGETRRYKLRTSNGQTFDRDIRKLVVLERGDDGEVIVLEGGGEESLS